MGKMGVPGRDPSTETTYRASHPPPFAPPPFVLPRSHSRGISRGGLGGGGLGDGGLGGDVLASHVASHASCESIARKRELLLEVRSPLEERQGEQTFVKIAKTNPGTHIIYM